MYEIGSKEILVLWRGFKSINVSIYLGSGDFASIDQQIVFISLFQWVLQVLMVWNAYGMLMSYLVKLVVTISSIFLEQVYVHWIFEE